MRESAGGELAPLPSPGDWTLNRTFHSMPPMTHTYVVLFGINLTLLRSCKIAVKIWFKPVTG
jgi:hypothetical protein